MPPQSTVMYIYNAILQEFASIFVSASTLRSLRNKPHTHVPNRPWHKFTCLLLVPSGRGVALVGCSVYAGILLFVAASTVPQGGVRPFIVLSYRYRLSNYRNFFDTILWYRYLTIISKLSIPFPILVAIYQGTCVHQQYPPGTISSVSKQSTFSSSNSATRGRYFQRRLNKRCWELGPRSSDMRTRNWQESILFCFVFVFFLSSVEWVK